MKTKFEGIFFYQIYKSPVGKIYIISTENHLSNIFFGKEKNLINFNNCTWESTPEIEKALLFLNNYFSSDEISNLNKIASGIKFNFDGFTPNEIKVYKNLLKVDFGKTFSYKELGVKSGFPLGARFIGNCMAKNRFPIIIPCHRVIKSDGSIGNYSGGPGIKEKLIKHEGILL
jgi:O-6-methylguanine DNA methyltransferase